MLTEITLENFKCFQEATTFPLSKINLLTGINGRGKSTLLQSLLLMKQSAEHDEYSDKVNLNGSCIDLGNFEDVKNRKINNKTPINFGFVEEDTYMKFDLVEYASGVLEITNFDMPNIFKHSKMPYHMSTIHKVTKFVKERVNIDLPANIPLIEEGLKSFTSQIKDFIPNKNDIEVSDLLASFFEDLLEHFKLKEPINKFFHITSRNYFAKIRYISADRLAPQKFYEVIPIPKFFDIDKQGKNIASIMDRLRDKIVNETMQIDNYSKDLLTQIGAYLTKIFDTNVEVNINTDASNHIILLKFIINGEEFTPPNVGFGYSHVLPIIVAGLIAEAGEILIIENPEAHLHPKAQSELTKFLAKVASCGVQVFIESHSDHILNGLRIVVKNQLLAPEDTKVLYFSKDKETNENKIYYPQIDADGRIDKWQEGFFDEWDNSLLELA